MNKNIQAQLMEGLEAQNKGLFADAKGKFQAVLKLDATNFAALYSLLVIEINLSNFKDALPLANRALQSNNKFTQAYYARALVHTQLGDPASALKDVEKTLELDPSFQAAIELKDQLKAQLRAQLKAQNQAQDSSLSENLLNPSSSVTWCQCKFFIVCIKCAKICRELCLYFA